MTSLYPLLFRPNLRETVWGGHRLEPLKGIPVSPRPIGESWEVSALPSSESVVADGALAGQTLSALTTAYGAALLGGRVAASGGQFPLLVKFIDAASDLSIQVHPNDTLARQRHGTPGKTEMWYVMAAAPGASLLLGLKEKLTPHELRRRVAKGVITDSLARIEVHAGDIFYIPAGRIHALCSGIMVCEIQQSSDVTYRLFDYHRLGLDGLPRQLHVEESMETIDYRVLQDYRTHYTPVEEGITPLVACDYFEVSLLTTRHTLHCDLRTKDSFVILSNVEGSCRLTAEGHSLVLHQGQSCLVPACMADFQVDAIDGRRLKSILSCAL